MNRLILLLLIFCITFFSCKKDYQFGSSELSAKVELTDINILLSTERKKFNNDTLKLKGTISISAENVSITDGESWIWIDSFEPATDFDTVYENMNYRDVEIIGLFDSENTGHMLGYNSGLKEVYFIKTE